MSRINNSLREIHTIDDLAQRDQWVNGIHPLVKLCLTVIYMMITVSFGKYELTGLLGMLVYPLILFELCELSIKEALYKLKAVLPFLCLVGLANPFFDREPVGSLGAFTVTSGMLSMCTLLIKGIFTVLSSYLLIATTTIEEICYALRLLHLPKLFVTQVLLTYRYLFVLLAETDTIVQAYTLRAPGQKGVHFRVWGSLAGQLLLRSMRRADELYQSMCLRGYDGEFYYASHRKAALHDVLYLSVWLTVMTAFRCFPVLELIGNLFV